MLEFIFDDDDDDDDEGVFKGSAYQTIGMLGHQNNVVFLNNASSLSVSPYLNIGLFIYSPPEIFLEILKVRLIS